MTFNRCGYARCAAPLHPDGPSLYWCDEYCQANWIKASNNALPLDPAEAEPVRAEPVRGVELTFVAVDEVAGIPDHAWPAAVALLDERERVSDGTQPLPDLPATAYPPDAVPLAPAPVNRTGWLGRILGARSIGIARGGDRR